MENKHKLKFKLKDWYNTSGEKYWKDPVWSKVISAVIIAVLGTILSGIGIVFRSIYKKIPITTVLNETIAYFKSSSEISNFLIWLSIIFMAFACYQVLKVLAQIIIKRFDKKENNKNNPLKEKPTISEKSTVFFSNRLAKSFPGQRGIEWYQPKIAADRLELLFQAPLAFKAHENHAVGDPIWWFRGGSSLFIDNFKKISKTKILLGIQELELKRVAVSIDDIFYEKSFIYIEAKGEQPTGLTKIDDNHIKWSMNNKGFYSEEYGLWKNKPINRREYEDGAIVRNNKVIDASDAELRTKYLTDYNIIIAAKQSPFNSQRFSRETEPMFRDILLGKLSIDDFFKYLESYKNESWRGNDY